MPRDKKEYAEAIRKFPPPALVVDRFVEDINSGNLCFTSNAPIRLAVRRGHTGIVKQLIDAGADVNETIIKSHLPTPLCVAISRGDTDTVKLLVDAGAKLEVTDLDFGNIVMPMFMAVQSGRLKIVTILLEAGCDPNPYLYSAIHKGHPEIVRALIKHGADVSCGNPKQSPALQYAINNGQGDIVDILREAGAKWETEEKGK